MRLFAKTGLLAALLASVACLVLSVGAFSQGIATGSISGTITDPSGAVLAGAHVRALSTATNQEYAGDTNDTGIIVLRSLPPGTYKITVTSASFRTAVIDNVEVSVARETSLGAVKLELGQVGETVQVEGTPPLLESTTSQTTTSFSTKEVADLPLSGSFDALTLLIPGVADSGNNSFSNSNGASFSTNGLRGRSNNFQIDGQSNNDNSVAGPSIFLGNQDALEEVSVITNDFGVEYGRASGSVVNYVTKSGGNEFHGSGFEYFTGNFADSHANEEENGVFGFCAPGVSPSTGCTPVGPPARYNEHRFGGSIGGPIKKNKAWFFFTPYFDRIRTAGAPSTSATFTPTPNGLTQLQAAFPGNAAVASFGAIGPYSVAAGNPQPAGSSTTKCPTGSLTTFGPTCTIPVSNGAITAPIDFALITRSVPSLFNDREFTGRVDVQLTSKDRVTSRYIFQQNINTDAAGTNSSGDWVDIPARDQQIALDWIHTFNNNILNQVRYSFSRAGFGFEGGSFPNCLRSSPQACPTGIVIQGSNLGFGIANNLPQGRIINNSQIQDNLSWLKGHHTLKLGGEFYKQRSPNQFLPQQNGTYTFSSTTGATCNGQFPGLVTATTNPTGTQCAFSRFLANAPLQLSLTQGPTAFNFKEYDIAAYAGDDWRIKENLTINLGLRWEYSSQAVNLLHGITVANQANTPPTWSNVPNAILPSVPNDFKYFAPTVGFAWKPRIFGMSGDKNVIRGGYRITYDPAYYNIFLNVATSAPVVNAGTIPGAACTAPCLVTSGFLGKDVQAAHFSDIPLGVNPGTRNNTQVENGFHEPRTQEWSLGIQHEFSSKIVFETRYVGNHVTGNFQTINANPALNGLIANGFSSFIPAGITPCTTAGAPGISGGRVDCNFRNVRNRENEAFSRYNGWQTQLRVQSWHGLSGAGSFTFSKTIDNSSEIFSTAFTGGGGNTVAGAQNPFDTTVGEKALSGLDFPKTASLYVIYELPFYKSQQGFVGKLLGGYQMNTLWHFSSGQLWTPTELTGGNTSCQNSFDASFYGASTCRPFLGNASAPVNMTGQCTNAALPNCGLVDFNTGAPISASAVRWIYNDDTSAAFFGTPYGNVGRNPHVRGQALSQVNMSVFKNTKLTERFSLRLEAQVYNLFNHLFLGVPDPVIDDGNSEVGSSFGSTAFNSSGGGYTNGTLNGYGRRRMILGAKIIF
ncbi:MAG TPA: TonB-dependent receptor [Candidatus Dormibacteraeota bacterium]|nr:TonB-dependent receptor [Candidatus Dormibacteraeota bacterium]